MDVKKGRFYTLDRAHADLAQDKHLEKKFTSLQKHHAEYFLVLRCIDKGTSLCVPIVKEQRKWQVPVTLSGNPYFADCLAFLTVPNRLLVAADMYYHNSYQLVERIYKCSKAHYKYCARRWWKRKALAREREKDFRVAQQLYRASAREIRSLSPQSRPASAVTWRMTHPAQGGRTSPR